MITPAPSQFLIGEHFSSRVVPPDGTGSSGILCCAEASGRHEDESGIPLHPRADAGSVFARALRRANIQRDSLTLTNVCWQHPPNDNFEGFPYELEARSYFLPHNEALIRERSPKVILLLGNSALKAFTPFGYADKTTILHMMSYPFTQPALAHEKGWAEDTIWLPTVHPSFILHGQQAYNQVLIWALQRALQLTRQPLSSLPTNYVTRPIEEDMLAFERGFRPDDHTLAFDIETPESDKLDEEGVEEKEEDVSYTIIRASLCYDAANGYAISFPWCEPFIAIAMRLLSRAKRLEVWNAPFDVPRLRNTGVIFNGKIIDRMRSWRFLQPTLRASLGFAIPLLGWPNGPWKHISESEPEKYSAQDAHALRWGGEQIETALYKRGAYDIHERHVVETFEVLEQMSRNGLPYNVQAAKEFEVRLEEMKVEREKELQRRVPDELKPLKQKKGYKKTPKITNGLVRRKFRLKVGELTGTELDTLNQYKLKLGDDDPFALPDLSNPDSMVEVERWAKLEPFLATSSQQMQALVKWAGFKPGTNRKTKKATIDDETKRKLIAKCLNSAKAKDKEFADILKMCREVSQLSKVIGTYLKGWQVGNDGRIHSTPGIWGKMMRISWRRPNIAATIQDKTEDAIAKGFRKCVSVSLGRMLVEADWKGIEAILVAYFADDKKYDRLARLGVHDYLTCHLLVERGKVPASFIPAITQPDNELTAIFREVKKRFPKDRDDAKHCIAEGQLVLTQRGLIAIQNIMVDDKLWDGVEWVSHDGVIYQGEREVITYDGLTATTDHEVVTSDGRIVPLGEAASQLDRLEATGIDGKAIWTCHRHLLECSARERISACESSMHEMRNGQMDRPWQFTPGEDQRVPLLCPSPRFSASSIGMAMGRYDWTLPTQTESWVLSLWGSGNQGAVPITRTFHRMDASEPSPSYISWIRDRSHRQQRPLCTGERPFSLKTRAKLEQERQPLVTIPREENTNPRVRQPLREIVDATPYPPRNDWRADYRECHSKSSIEGEASSMGETSGVARTARVYDILNAGPRRCFTVSNKLVLNCVHGTNYSMTPPLMSSLYEMPLAEAERIQALYFDLFPKIRQWQESVKEKAHQGIWLQNPFGYRMPFFEIYRWNSQRYERLISIWRKQEGYSPSGSRWELTKSEKDWIAEINKHMAAGLTLDDATAKLCYDLGDDAKSAISFLPRDTAAAMLKEVLLRLRPLAFQHYDAGFMIGSAHDAILTEVPESKMEDVARLLQREMESPVEQLDGLIVNVEVKAGRSWDSDSMEVLELDSPKEVACAS